MKDAWIKKYKESRQLGYGNHLNVLVGFNANIDVSYDVDELDWNYKSSEPVNHDKVSNMDELEQLTHYCVNNQLNKEIKRNGFQEEFKEPGKKKIGGQAGIISNFLNRMNNYAIFYTPLLSEELTNLLDEDIVYPILEGENLRLKKVSEAINTDRFKKNTILEFKQEHTGRLILSDTLKGFGPFFRKGIEEKLQSLDKESDRMIFSGFHNAEGNFESKIEKAGLQLTKIASSKHLEYTNMADDHAEALLEEIVPNVDSIGFDEEEAKQLASLLGVDIGGKIDILDALDICKELINEKDIYRVHLHTYDYHLTVTRNEYPVKHEKIREAMLFSEVCAMVMGDKGKIPNLEEVKGFSMEKKHLKRVDYLEKLGDQIETKRFARHGLGNTEEGYKVVAIPSLIHEDPKRLVGMGDIISSGAFIGELK